MIRGILKKFFFDFFMEKRIWFFGQGRFFFPLLRAETWQDGLYICPEQRQMAPNFILCNQLFITMPYLKNPSRTMGKVRIAIPLTHHAC